MVYFKSILLRINAAVGFLVFNVYDFVQIFRYLRLLTEEHAIIKNEQLLITEVRKADEAEKVAFDELSSTLRISRAKEQEQLV